MLGLLAAILQGAAAAGKGALAGGKWLGKNMLGIQNGQKGGAAAQKEGMGQQIAQGVMQQANQPANIGGGGTPSYDYQPSPYPVEPFQPEQDDMFAPKRRRGWGANREMLY